MKTRRNTLPLLAGISAGLAAFFYTRGRDAVEAPGSIATPEEAERLAGLLRRDLEEPARTPEPETAELWRAAMPPGTRSLRRRDPRHGPHGSLSEILSRAGEEEAERFVEVGSSVPGISMYAHPDAAAEIERDPSLRAMVEAIAGGLRAALAPPGERRAQQEKLRRAQGMADAIAQGFITADKIKAAPLWETLGKLSPEFVRDARELLREVAKNLETFAVPGARVRKRKTRRRLQERAARLLALADTLPLRFNGDTYTETNVDLAADALADASWHWHEGEGPHMARVRIREVLAALRGRLEEDVGRLAVETPLEAGERVRDGLQETRDRAMSRLQEVAELLLGVDGMDGAREAVLEACDAVDDAYRIRRTMERAGLGAPSTVTGVPARKGTPEGVAWSLHGEATYANSGLFFPEFLPAHGAQCPECGGRDVMKGLTPTGALRYRCGNGRCSREWFGTPEGTEVAAAPPFGERVVESGGWVENYRPADMRPEERFRLEYINEPPRRFREDPRSRTAPHGDPIPYGRVRRDCRTLGQTGKLRRVCLGHYAEGYSVGDLAAWLDVSPRLPRGRPEDVAVLEGSVRADYSGEGDRGLYQGIRFPRDVEPMG